MHDSTRLAFFALALLTTGCIGGDSASSSSAHAIDVNGMQREYRLFTPAAPPAGEMPLLIAVHGGSGREDRFPQQTEFEALAEEQGLVIAYPLSELQPGNEGEWLLNTAPESRHDLDFMEALIDDISARHSIDATRIYGTGYSLGSMFTYELACHLSNRFAAVASHAGAMPASPNSCAPEHNIGVMHLHGVQDPIIPYSSGWSWKEWDQVGSMLSTPELIQFWAQQNACQESSETAGSSSSHLIHSGCGQNVRVEHHRLETVGHEWPDEIEGQATYQLLWSFLQDFQRLP